MGVNKTLPDQPAPEIISGPGLTARDGTVSVHVENDSDMPSNIQVTYRLKVCLHVPTSSPSPSKVYHCANGDGRFDWQNG